jgi:hypothetical protein
MNDYRRFVYILQKNGIENFKEQELIGTDNGFLILKNKNTEKILKVDITANEKPISLKEWEKRENPPEKPFVPKEEPLYKQLTPEDRIFSDLKDLNQNDEEVISPVMEDYDYDDDDFDQIENVNELKTPPKLDFDEEFKKEMEKIKKEQEEMIKNKTKKKEDPKKDIPGSKPRGWHLREEYVDDKGNVYFKGVVQPELKGTKEPTK